MWFWLFGQIIFSRVTHQWFILKYYPTDQTSLKLNLRVWCDRSRQLKSISSATNSTTAKPANNANNIANLQLKWRLLNKLNIQLGTREILYCTVDHIWTDPVWFSWHIRQGTWSDAKLDNKILTFKVWMTACRLCLSRNQGIRAVYGFAHFSQRCQPNYLSVPRSIH